MGTNVPNVSIKEPSDIYKLLCFDMSLQPLIHQSKSGLRRFNIMENITQLTVSDYWNSNCIIIFVPDAFYVSFLLLVSNVAVFSSCWYDWLIWNRTSIHFMTGSITRGSRFSISHEDINLCKWSLNQNKNQISQAYVNKTVILRHKSAKSFLTFEFWDFVVEAKT